jgi:hypothetical protein
LSQAWEVFDDWAKSYYTLIFNWKRERHQYFANVKQIYLSKIALPHKYGGYEIFNQILHNWLYEEQFDFMHQEFKEFLERIHSDDFSYQPSFFD